MARRTFDIDPSPFRELLAAITLAYMLRNCRSHAERVTLWNRLATVSGAPERCICAVPE